jgi:hypothetical protein
MLSAEIVRLMLVSWFVGSPRQTPAPGKKLPAQEKHTHAKLESGILCRKTCSVFCILLLLLFVQNRKETRDSESFPRRALDRIHPHVRSTRACTHELRHAAIPGMPPTRTAATGRCFVRMQTKRKCMN